MYVVLFFAQSVAMIILISILESSFMKVFGRLFYILTCCGRNYCCKRKHKELPQKMTSLFKFMATKPSKRIDKSVSEESSQAASIN